MCKIETFLFLKRRKTFSRVKASFSRTDREHYGFDCICRIYTIYAEQEVYRRIYKIGSPKCRVLYFVAACTKSLYV